MDVIKKTIFESRNVNKVLSQKQIKAIEVITGPKTEDDDGYHVYGSTLYRAQNWPSDTDGIQNYTFCKKYGCDRKSAEKMGVKIIQEIVTKIINGKGTYLGDIKIGVDTEIEDTIEEIQDITQDGNKKILKQWNELLSKNKKEYELSKKINYIGNASHTKLDEAIIPQLLIHGYEVDYPYNDVLNIWKKKIR